MTQEWFSLGELRAVMLPGVDEDFLRRLAGKFGAVPTRHARTRLAMAPGEFAAEFHVSMLPRAAREKLARTQSVDAAAIVARCEKLGIHRLVMDPRSKYVGPNIDAEIARAEWALQELRRARQAAA